MKIKTQHVVFDSNKEPIQLILNDAEKQMICQLKKELHTFTVFPQQMKSKTAEEKLKSPMLKKKGK